MRFMGVDYGSKRVGIAFSDENAVMAFPHAVLDNSPSLTEDILALAKEKGVGGIVIGHSIDKESEANVVQEAVDTFAQSLKESSSLPVYLEDERYTTQEALRIQGRTPKTDAAAAALILNAYLTRISRTS